MQGVTKDAPDKRREYYDAGQRNQALSLYQSMIVHTVNDGLVAFPKDNGLSRAIPVSVNSTLLGSAVALFTWLQDVLNYTSCSGPVFNNHVRFLFIV